MASRQNEISPPQPQSMNRTLSRLEWKPVTPTRLSSAFDQSPRYLYSAKPQPKYFLFSIHLSNESEMCGRKL